MTYMMQQLCGQCRDAWKRTAYTWHVLNVAQGILVPEQTGTGSARIGMEVSAQPCKVSAPVFAQEPASKHQKTRQTVERTARRWPAASRSSWWSSWCSRQVTAPWSQVWLQTNRGCCHIRRPGWAPRFLNQTCSQHPVLHRRPFTMCPGASCSCSAGHDNRQHGHAPAGPGSALAGEPSPLPPQPSCRCGQALSMHPTLFA